MLQSNNFLKLNILTKAVHKEAVIHYFLGSTQRNEQFTSFSELIGEKIKVKSNHSHEKIQYIKRKRFNKKAM